MKTKIFLDGGIPDETREAIELLGFLDGQTTNPSLITKHPSFIACAENGDKCSEQEAWQYYRDIVSNISPLVEGGSVSIEVYADHQTTSDEMIEKGIELNTWIPNAHIKLPITHEGLVATETLVKKGIRVNMTLCFSQEQAAAVYVATRGAKKGEVFLSPFVGRLDDIGQNGMGFIANVIRMFEGGDGHVEVLVASVRSSEHFNESLRLGADIITAPLKILKVWQASGRIIPEGPGDYDNGELAEIPYEELDLTRDWREFNISHNLTDRGIDRFARDWNTLVA